MMTFSRLPPDGVPDGLSAPADGHRFLDSRSGACSLMAFGQNAMFSNTVVLTMRGSGYPHWRIPEPVRASGGQPGYWNSVVKDLLQVLLKTFLPGMVMDLPVLVEHGQNLNQFRLSVSVDTSQTYNLALAHIQVGAL